MRRTIRWILIAMLAACCGLTTWAPADPPVGGTGHTGGSDAGLKQYQSKYYIIHSDLDVDDVREAAVRMTAMAEEYHQRTANFAGTVRQRLPFYLYHRREDYEAAGGLPGSGGVFIGAKLLALAGPAATGATWQVVQHEGFHQFARQVIGGDFPVWIDEGLADYFGKAVFTGDGFISGVIPEHTRQDVVELIRTGKAKPFSRMMQMTHQQWNEAMDLNLYLQAWSMIHFLVHADTGRYQQPFEAFIRAVSKGGDWQVAWRNCFKTDVNTVDTTFQKRWSQWWLDLPERPTVVLYEQAVVATITSYFARAYSQNQPLKTLDDFFKAAEEKNLRCNGADWLPPSLLVNAMKAAPAMGKWSLLPNPGMPPRLRCELADRTVFISQFTLKGDRVERVGVQVLPTSQPARK
jgi:hypothetical protein